MWTWVRDVLTYLHVGSVKWGLLSRPNVLLTCLHPTFGYTEQPGFCLSLTLKCCCLVGECQKYFGEHRQKLIEQFVSLHKCLLVTECSEEIVCKVWQTLANVRLAEQASAIYLIFLSVREWLAWKYHGIYYKWFWCHLNYTIWWY